MKMILFFLSVMILSSCGRFSDGTSVWQQGLWILPWALGLASAWSFYRAWRSYRSGSWYWDRSIPEKPVRRESDEKVPMHQIGSFWFGVGFLIALIVVLVWVNSEK